MQGPVDRSQARKALALLVVATFPIEAWTQQATDTRVVLTVDKPSFFLGENVLLHFCVENVSAAPLTISAPGGARGDSSGVHFKVTLTDEQGRTIAHPDQQGYREDGLSVAPTIAPGGRSCQSIPLSRYARIEQTGTYLVHVTHDLGWPAGRAPEGQLPVTFTMPAPVQAEAVVSTMESLPLNDGQVKIMGALQRPFRDFSTLRYPVYLPILTRRARSGSAEALVGVGAIPTADATLTLIDLLEHTNTEVAHAARQQLARRLPHPVLDGASIDLQRDLREASWRASMAPAVRATGRRLLASSNEQDVAQGALMIESVGAVADGPDLLAALGRAIELTPRLRPSVPASYPRPRGAVPELLRAADALVTRGFGSRGRNSTGAIAIWLVGIGHGARPAGWAEAMLPLLSHRIPYVRELALDRMPAEVPPSLVGAISANLDPSVELEVRIAACHVVGRGRLTALRADVVRTLQAADEQWLLTAAAKALYALGAGYDSLMVMTSRLAETAVSNQMLASLLRASFDFQGIVHTLDPVLENEGRMLADRWRAFLTAHRDDIAAQRRIPFDDPSVSTELMPHGWALVLQDNSNWPRR